MKITDKHGNKWVLAPEEAVNTQSQKGVACNAVSSFKLNYYEVDEIYRAMLAATPEPELIMELETVAWIDSSGHPRHLSYLQGINEKKFYGPLKPLVLRSDVEAIITRLRQELAAEAINNDELVAQKDEEITDHIQQLRKEQLTVERQAKLIAQCREALGMLIINTDGSVWIGPHGIDLQTKALAAIEKEAKE